ncbi:Protein MgtC [Seminavis robusta]|uniref:Protein MgtC n=1 Tax=Seminavis robusta TaxID=568900 RepID=A0A9N8DDI7_9STRA|nr:Protein MgtC [Seminavis robusta]|eukprot:Sro24_g016330.1 Protein MgtC (181) ;mRNA; f:36636-37178
MSLVALGSCLFSICSAFAFLSSPMAWDASRVSAAIPSGVGFLGSALIFKNKDDENNNHEVHGLTTAASVWLSAAVGIACAGGMYFVASLSTAIMLVLLRFGPRTNFPPGDDDDDDESIDDEDETEVGEAIANINAKKIYQSIDPEKQPIMTREIRPSLSNSQRSSAAKRTSTRLPRPSLI